MTRRSSSGGLVRWLIAGTAFVGIALVDTRYGHRAAFVLMMAALVFIAVFGGTSHRATGAVDIEGGEGIEGAAAAQELRGSADHPQLEGGAGAAGEDGGAGGAGGGDDVGAVGEPERAP